MFICGWEKRRLVVDILSCLSLSLKLLCNLSHSDGMSLLRIQTDFAQSFWRISRRNIYFSVHACASFVLCKRLVSIIKLFTSAFCLISSSFWACFNISMLRIFFFFFHCIKEKPSIFRSYKCCRRPPPHPQKKRML